MRRAFPVVYARDVKGAVNFYAGLLGFEQQYQFPPDGEPGYVGLRRDEADLGIVHESSLQQMTFPKTRARVRSCRSSFAADAGFAGVGRSGRNPNEKPFEVVVMLRRQPQRTSNGEMGGSCQCANQVIAAPALE